MADYVSNYSGDQIDEAVGRALPGGALDTGKAPAGFGLGKMIATLPKIADAHAIWETGWYSVATGTTANIPATGLLRAEVYAYSVVHLTLYTNAIALDGSITIIHQQLTGKGWSPWEYEHPPMHLGIEYRTTERYQGKPVYAKLVDCGYGPNSTSKSILHNIADYGMTVSAFGTVVSNGGKWEVHDVSSSTIRSIGATKEAVFLFSSTDQTSNKVYVLLKYTKTTD